MQCRVSKNFNETIYLVKVDDHVYMETTDLAEIPLVMADLVRLGEVEPEQLQYMRIIEQKVLDIGLEARTTVTLVQPKQ